MEMNTIEELKERVILIGVSVSDGDDTEESLKELKELADTAGAETVGTLIQKREAIHPGTYIGKGKIEEVRAMAFGLNATGVICDDELSPAQLNNLEQELDLKVMDRTLIILDIFAAHARTSEGKSLPSSNTARQDWSVFEILCPVWEAVSEPEDRERKSWKWTVGSSRAGSPS